MTKPKKKRFEVTEHETIDTILTLMKEEGYMP
ncbi:NETI motif-containing protein, partial [Salinicoccus roseus]